jgi:hypothetical protein
MNTVSLSHHTPLSEFLTVEQLSDRLQVSRATLFNWMKKDILTQGRHYFKRGRVLRFIWSDDLIQELLAGSPEDMEKVSPEKPYLKPIRQIKSSPINWDY